MTPEIRALLREARSELVAHASVVAADTVARIDALLLPHPRIVDAVDAVVVFDLHLDEDGKPWMAAVLQAGGIPLGGVEAETAQALLDLLHQHRWVCPATQPWSSPRSS